MRSERCFVLSIALSVGLVHNLSIVHVVGSVVLAGIQHTLIGVVIIIVE